MRRRRRGEEFRISITFTHTFDGIGVFLGNPQNKQHPSLWALLVWAEAMPGGFGAEKCCPKVPGYTVHL